MNQIVFKAETTQDDENLVFGWVSVAVDKSGSQVVDGEGDVIDPSVLERAAYKFVEQYGEANVNHAGPTVGRLVESVALTPAKKALMDRNAPEHGVWMGFRVDDETFAKVKDRSLRSFSIEGTARRTPA